ncbi:MAG: hypothetical protein FWC06_03320 [Treponema sp.]|nr:hypothetical protein [Treponema sp.]
MINNRIVFVVVFGLLLNIACGASMVSFIVIETGLPENVSVNQHSEQWENAFMDVFFDAGYIVSNAPILRIGSKPIGDLLSAACDIDEIKSLGIDFLLIAHLDYSGEPRIPAEISLLIYKVTSDDRLLERQFPGKSYRSNREEHDDIRSIIRGFVPYIR